MLLINFGKPYSEDVATARKTGKTMPQQSTYGRNDQSLVGTAAALAAFGMWAFFPVYFKAVSSVPAFEVLSHRIFWTFILLAAIIIATARGHRVRAVFGNRKLLSLLLLSSLLISTNWLIFIWAVANDALLELSLGYFINPLVSIALGTALLKERLRPWQWVAVGLSVLAVGYLIGKSGVVPWVALSVAVTFGLYGLIRKIAVVDAISGLFIETALVLPPILAYLVYIFIEGTGSFGLVNLKLDGLLVMAGVMTATPLVLFAMAARKLPLSTLGFFQYLVPTGHFLLAVFLYNEPFTDSHKATFGIIWLALVVYTSDSFAARRKGSD